MVHHGEAIERQQSICTITRERPMPNLSKLDFKKVGDPLTCLWRMMTGKPFVPKSTRRCGGGIEEGLVHCKYYVSARLGSAGRALSPEGAT
jgi:hypothetical protein